VHALIVWRPGAEISSARVSVRTWGATRVYACAFFAFINTLVDLVFPFPIHALEIVIQGAVYAVVHHFRRVAPKLLFIFIRLLVKLFIEIAWLVIQERGLAPWFFFMRRPFLDTA